MEEKANHKITIHSPNSIINSRYVNNIALDVLNHSPEALWTLPALPFPPPPPTAEGGAGIDEVPSTKLPT